MEPSIPKGFELVVNVIIGGFIKGLIELFETRLPSVSNSIIVSVSTALGLGIAYGTSLFMAPGLSLESIAIATFAGVGVGSLLNSATNKPLQIRTKPPPESGDS